MRITDDYQDYRFTSLIKGRHYLALRKRRVEKIREEEFGEELKESMHQQNPNLKGKVDLKKKINKYQLFLNEHLLY